MSNGNEFATKSPNRIYVTGDCDGLPDLRDALAAHPEVELVGSATPVAEAAATLTRGDFNVVLHPPPARGPRGDAAGERAGRDPRAHAGAADPGRLERLPGPAGGGARA